MNCRNVGKFLFAFADGQLSVQSNCEVLDHLKMCPRCSSIVDEHQGIRRSLRHTAEKVVVPHGLEGRVRKAIAAGQAIDHKHQLRQNRVGRILALAACIMLAFSGWYLYSTGRFSSASFLAGMDPTVSSPEDVARLVVNRHNKCVELCRRQSHQDSSLPSDRNLVAKAISEHYGSQLAALAPDLRNHGFDFDSANFCCILKKDNCAAGHVMYVNLSNSAHLSLFSLPQTSLFSDVSEEHAAGKDHLFVQTEQNCNSSISVAAWSLGGSTFVLCGDVSSEEELRQISKEMKASSQFLAEAKTPSMAP